MAALIDKFGRPITDLRISITDHCNYKCVYCRTGNEGALYADLPISDYLRMACVLAGLGIKKVRITGGEPLLRKGVIDFVRELSKLRSLDGEPLDIAITTNGHLLAEMAQPLKEAGLHRVTVSMDAVDPERLDEILRRMAEYRPLRKIAHAHSETARRYRFEDGIGEIGIIAPVSHPFCGHCSRIRITSDGKIRTCLFSVWDHDLYGRMRSGASDEELEEFIRGVIQKKEARHHIGEPDFVRASRTMVHIGG